jgi:glycosyltransferase involved in cell wall biosynthesis
MISKVNPAITAGIGEARITSQMNYARIPKILMFGHCGLHVFGLASALKAKQSVKLSAFEILTPGKELLGDNVESVLDAVYRLNANRRSTLVDLVALCWQVPSWQTFYRLVRRITKLLIFGVIAPQKLRGIDQNTRYLRVFSEIQREFDVLHLHFMWPTLAEFVRLIPDTKKLVVTIWGSDLLRVKGAENHRLQQQISRRASIITVRSSEMKEVLLSRFGRELERKVRIVKFGSPVITLIQNSDLASLRRDFRADSEVGDDQLIVCVGHNGFRQNQHIEVLTALGALNDQVKARLVFLVPMTYGNDSGYAEECEALAREKQLNLRVLRKFMPHGEVVRLRAASDIMIHVPTTDALSGAMCETIFCGNIVITGTWLRHGELRHRNIYHHEVDSIARLPDVLAAVAHRIEEEKTHVAASADRIRELVDWDVVISQWIAVYDELLGQRLSHD